MSGSLEAYLPLVLLVVVGYLLLIRPARNRAKAAAQLQAALSPGDEVAMLTSGIFATVIEINADSDVEIVRVEVGPGTQIRVLRRAIGQIIVDRSAERRDEDPPFDPGETPGDDSPGVN